MHHEVELSFLLVRNVPELCVGDKHNRHVLLPETLECLKAMVPVGDGEASVLELRGERLTLLGVPSLCDDALHHLPIELCVC